MDGISPERAKAIRFGIRMTMYHLANLARSTAANCIPMMLLNIRGLMRTMKIVRLIMLRYP